MGGLGAEFRGGEPRSLFPRSVTSTWRLGDDLIPSVPGADTRGRRQLAQIRQQRSQTAPRSPDPGRAAAKAPATAAVCAHARLFAHVHGLGAGVCSRIRTCDVPAKDATRGRLMSFCSVLSKHRTHSGSRAPSQKWSPDF